MNEWERVEKERKLREQAEATGAFINMMLDELTEAKDIIKSLLSIINYLNEDEDGKEDFPAVHKAEAFLKE